MYRPLCGGGWCGVSSKPPRDVPIPPRPRLDRRDSGVSAAVWGWKVWCLLETRTGRPYPSAAQARRWAPITVVGLGTCRRRGAGSLSSPWGSAPIAAAGLGPYRRRGARPLSLPWGWAPVDHVGLGPCRRRGAVPLSPPWGWAPIAAAGLGPYCRREAVPLSPPWGWAPIAAVGLGPFRRRGAGPLLPSWGYAPVAAEGLGPYRRRGAGPLSPPWGWAPIAAVGLGPYRCRGARPLTPPWGWVPIAAAGLGPYRRRGAVPLSPPQGCAHSPGGTRVYPPLCGGGWCGASKPPRGVPIPPRPRQDRRDSGVSAAVWGWKVWCLLKTPTGRPYPPAAQARHEGLGCIRRCVGVGGVVPPQTGMPSAVPTYPKLT